MMILGGSTSTDIAKDLAMLTNNSLLDVTIKRFPDGELNICINENIKNKEIMVIQTTFPDDKIIELFLLLDACKKADAKKITVVIPYYGYARQDKQFKKGEPVSAEVFAKLISLYADEIITVDPHKDHILDFFSVPTSKVSAIHQIASYLEPKQIDVILAPDRGALPNAEIAAKQLGCAVDYLEKTRIDGNTVKCAPKNLKVKGKKVAIIDDIISTGGTMANAITELKKQQAIAVYVACTHGIFAGQAIQKLTNAKCDEIIATDTIQTTYSKVKIAPILSEFF